MLSAEERRGVDYISSNDGFTAFIRCCDLSETASRYSIGPMNDRSRGADSDVDLLLIDQRSIPTHRLGWHLDEFAAFHQICNEPVDDHEKVRA